MSTVDVVIIGRNEGVRLVRALDAALQVAGQIIYVDSGSSDNSIEEAKARGAKVVSLDMTVPFTAARARNAGFEALSQPQFVQFIDGDCALVAEFITAAAAHLEANPKIGIVTGWRSEIFPQASIYNQLAHLEWRQPAGPIVTCGGDMMVRAEAFTQVNGFNPSIIAAEDDDFCLRVGKAGWQLERLPLEMTQHDADMHSFGQWWQRATRAGHGFAQINRLHPGHFQRPLMRIYFWAVGLPLFALFLLPWSILGVVVMFLLFGVSFWRTRSKIQTDDMLPGQTTQIAALLTLSKFPNLVGVLKYYRRLFTHKNMHLIEYK